jgi:hypothetical protein
MLSLRARLLAAVLLLTLVAAAFGATVTEHLGAAGFQDPSSPSARGMKVLTTKFGQGDMHLTLVVRAPGSVQDPAAAAAGRLDGGFLRQRNFYGVVAVVRHCHVDDRR